MMVTPNVGVGELALMPDQADYQDANYLPA